MTPATSPVAQCHDTLIRMPGKGTTRRTIRADADLWDRFGQQATGANVDRATAVKEFMRHCVDHPGALARLLAEWRDSPPEPEQQ